MQGNGRETLPEADDCLDDRIVQGRKEMENLQQKLDELASLEREDDRMLAVLEHQSRKTVKKSKCI